jgi:hypothetical protein
LRGGTNTYSYVDGSPVEFIDPKGEATEALLGTCIFGGPFNPACDVALIINGCKWALIAGVVLIAAGETCQNGACSMADDDEDEDDNCEALYQSTLRTCASLSGRKKFRCFEVARINRDQCYQQRNRDR